MRDGAGGQQGPLRLAARRVRTGLDAEARELSLTPSPLAGRSFPLAGQAELGRRILSSIGFDFARGRLDSSTHPFTESSGRDDVRLTARTKERDLYGLVLAGLHEG